MILQHEARVWRHASKLVRHLRKHQPVHMNDIRADGRDCACYPRKRCPRRRRSRIAFATNVYSTPRWLTMASCAKR